MLSRWISHGRIFLKRQESVLVTGLGPACLLAVVFFWSAYGVPIQSFLVPYLALTAFLVYRSGLWAGISSACLGFIFFTTCRFAFETSFGSSGPGVIGLCVWFLSAAAIILLVSKLKVQKDLFISLMKNLPIGVYIKEARNFRFLHINSQGSSFFGLSEASIVGKNARDFFSAEQAHIFDSHDREILASGIAREVELEKVFTKDRGDRFVRTKKWPVRASDNKSYLLGLSEDITARTRSENKLRASEMKYRSLVHSALDAVIGADVEGKIISWNKSAETLFGYSEVEVLGHSLQIIMPERFREMHQRGISKVVETRNSKLSGKNAKLTGLKKTGEEFALEMAMSHWFTDDSDLCFTAVVRDISEQIRSSDALGANVLERTRDFAHLSESIPQLVWSIDPNGNGIYFNQRWTDYTGISLDVPGRWEDIVHAEDVERSKTAWGDSLLSGKPFSIEYRLKGPDNLYRWHLNRAIAIRNSNGNITKWVGTSTDIQSQVEIKETLLGLKQLTDSVIQDAPVLLWAVDKNGIFTYYEGKVAKILGLKAQDRIGISIFDLYDGRAEIAGNVRRALQGETVTGESQIGNVFLENKFSPQFDSSGNINGVVGLSIDITEKKRQYRELQKFEQIFQRAHWGMAIASADNIFLQVNQAFANMHGSTPDEWIGRPISEMFPQDEVRDGSRVDAQLARTGHISYEAVHSKKDKTEFSVLADISNVVDNNGSVIYRVANYIDLTDKHKAEEARAKAEIRSQTAIEASRIKSEFLATMSHEIRTPLNGVIGMINLLLDTPLSNEQKNYGNVLLNSADSLLVLINDILDLSKAEAGKIDLEVIDFDLQELIQRIEDAMKFSADQKGLKLIVKLDKNLPRFIQADPTRLQQILLNLVNNAVKFTSQGEITISSRYISSQAKTKLRFEISDTGLGIAEESIHKMFLSFSQADASTTRKFGGTGLGLSICKHLVNLMGGTIGVESVENAGSTFWFEVPIKVGTRPKIAIEQSASGQEKIAHLRILLAEDMPVNQLLAVKMLEKMGHTVTVANNGLEALKVLQAEKYDLVLMDGIMPELDGYETTRRIRAGETLQPQIPIFAMTANAMTGDREKCLSIGMNDYITKPVKFAQLRELINRNFDLTAQAKASA